MFEQLGAGEDILETLRQALVNDLKRMRALDPERRDVDAAIESAGGQRRRKSATGEEAAVSSEQELSVLRGRVNRALQVIVQLQRHGVLSREAVGRTRQGLEVLAVRVGINSFVLMARHALEKGNAMKAFSCYRKAERLARYTSLPEGQRRENLERIEAEKEQLLRGQDDRGLMLLAAGK